MGPGKIKLPEYWGNEETKSPKSFIEGTPTTPAGDLYSKYDL